ncbi:MAG: metal-dependent transcriptional regulator [Deltaproteobacteria bacterium]|nr:metal-dependent transcriptional regulator [Deltaproteobacteria bacterium]MBW2040502.1 metal-dependent transcriptional regulator [Deltaproteobacteria bacterium]MBW2131370.1 metal-dependent transcriptional regulator [Deltaproteobacteria bacterium]
MERLSESLEDYLETILILQNKNTVARVKEIAERLGVLSGTVTSALRTLSEKKLIHYKPYGFITLTSRGKTIAKEVLRRHTILKNFLQSVLLLDAPTAEENACRVEHAMDSIAIHRLVQFIEYIDQCPRAGKDWIDNFHTFFTRNKIAEANCPECLDACVRRFQAASKRQT